MRACGGLCDLRSPWPFRRTPDVLGNPSQGERLAGRGPSLCVGWPDRMERGSVLGQASSQMDARLRSLQRLEWLAALGLLAALAALAYAPFLRQLGFYRDDWYVLWAAGVHGSPSLVTLFSI